MHQHNDNYSGLSVEDVTGGVVNVCHRELVPIFPKNSIFWQPSRQRNRNDSRFIYFSDPYNFIQLASILLAIHILSYILKPLRLPRFSVELLVTILIAEGMKSWYPLPTIPFGSVKALNTMGHVGLVCYVFLMGLEINLSTVRYIGREAVYTGLTGMVLPLSIGFIQFFVIAADSSYLNFFSPKFWENLAPVRLSGAIFWQLSLTITSFSDLARILSDIKLLHTDIGRLALSSCIVSELTTWILIVISITLNYATLNPLYLLPTITFSITTCFIIRPAVVWILKHAEETNNKLLLDFVILWGIMVSSLVTDTCGTGFLIGPFVFGLIIPNENVGVLVMDKFEDYFRGILIPAFFMNFGMRLDFHVLINPVYDTHLYTIFLIIVVAWLAKFASTFVFSKLTGRTTREAFTLGVLMNTKGVEALAIINMGQNNQGFNSLMFAVLTISILAMSVTVMPLAKAANKSNRRSNKFNARKMESNKLELELRVLTCIHSTRNLSGMINLLEYSNASKQYPTSVFALHLVQLTARRATAMLIVHDNSKNNNNTSKSSQSTFEGSGQNLSRRQEESKNIIATFKSLENRGASVSTESLTIVSPYTTMHEDVNCLGEDKRVMLILVPFHKQADVYGRLQDENLNWRTVNKNLMATATCSVGILVDRGLGSKDRRTQPQSSFVVIFVQGPDDREALTLGWRMAKSPNVNLTMLRLISTNDVDHNNDVDGDHKEEGSLEGKGGGAIMRNKRDEKKLDDEYVNEFRFRTMHDKSIKYIEKQVKNGEEAITMIGRVMPHCDLYILGQHKKVTSSVMMGLSEWTEYDELGVLGDTLLSTDFAEHSSLIVIRQHHISKIHM